LTKKGKTKDVNLDFVTGKTPQKKGNQMTKKKQGTPRCKEKFKDLLFSGRGNRAKGARRAANWEKKTSQGPTTGRGDPKRHDLGETHLTQEHRVATGKGGGKKRLGREIKKRKSKKNTRK